MSSEISAKRRIILGLMTLGPDATHGARITSLDEFSRCLDLFQEKGYGEVDTARLYDGGRQEAFTRQTGWKERGLSMATKWAPLTSGAHRAEILEERLDESLRELGTDQVDIFYLHAADRTTPFPETFEALDRLYRQGKFKQLGLSNFSAFEVAEVATLCNERGWVRPTIYQAIYNALTRGIEDELIPCCRRWGIDVVVFNPLAGGFFSGKYKTAEQPADGRFSDGNPMQGKMYRDRYFKSSIFRSLKILEPVAQKHGLSMVEVALRWCVHHSALRITDGRDGIITGFSSFEQLEGNLNDLEKDPLPTEVLDALDQAWSVAKVDASKFWHGELVYGYETPGALLQERS
ncbi:aflatoxin B1 aldehyde reductase member 2 [Aspergillus violaceofuscus CBS 115571]|uniref:D-xylose reductase [NAD(P)H] n=1 Tax=Aspergillus violaceofuscus (strain CBS 115571) TaxID=1450538 RepID=A0A2V5GX94_ASPV1|nr:aflatoxin B1 aldehyde reductase member 2 [Aspergillus violaceofuscus CBS 115571]